MKYLSVITITLLISTGTRSQTSNEWFNQKQTQIKYLIEQIATLQVYSGYLEKGYKIVKNGSKVIGDIKKGDINLHSDYFSSLRNVNPLVKKYSKIAKIIETQLQLLSLYHKSLKNVTKSDALTRGEINYCSSVFSNLINQTGDIIDVLVIVTTSGLIEMRDNDRIKKIDALYADMQAKLAFAQKFSKETELLIFQRNKENSDIQVTRSIYGIK